MKTVNQLIDEVIAREGGYVNHPSDPGGATKYGITLRVARGNGYPGNMKDFPRAFAVEIYRRLYWTRPGLDKVAAIFPLVAEELFDTGINMGPGRAGEFLQRALNGLNRRGRDFADLKVDGDIGPATIRALDAYRRARSMIGERVLVAALDCLQGAHYIGLTEANSKFDDFLFGWLSHRIRNVKI